MVRLYAICRERAHTDRIELSLPDEGETVADLKSRISRAVPQLAELLPLVRVALNQEFAKDSDRVREGDELALIPPVSGGSGLGLFALRDRAIDAREVEAAVAGPTHGAIATFLGTVRARTGEDEVVALEYEAYPEMAERHLRKIGDAIQRQWPGTAAAILHRVGRLEVAEVSVAIAVASPHRKDAFEACRYAIEALKADVPIWKKEVRRDGSVWVGVGS